MYVIRIENIRYLIKTESYRVIQANKRKWCPTTVSFKWYSTENRDHFLCTCFLIDISNMHVLVYWDKSFPVIECRQNRFKLSLTYLYTSLNMIGRTSHKNHNEWSERDFPIFVLFFFCCCFSFYHFSSFNDHRKDDQKQKTKKKNKNKNKNKKSIEKSRQRSSMKLNRDVILAFHRCQIRTRKGCPTWLKRREDACFYC